VQLSSEDNDKWGPKDIGLKLDWRTKFTSFESMGFKSMDIKKEPAILKKFETLNIKNGSADNPAFIPDNY